MTSPTILCLDRHHYQPPSIASGLARRVSDSRQMLPIPLEGAGQPKTTEDGPDARRNPAFHRRQTRARAERPVRTRVQSGDRRAERLACRSPASRKSMKPSPRRRRRFPAGRRPRRCAGRASCTVSCACWRRTRTRIAVGDHRRTWQGAVRRAGRADARHRGRRIRDRRAASPEGRGHRECRHPRRQPLAAPAARRRRRHHAVQLPGHGADVDVPGGAGLRQLLHPEAVGARPVGLA